MYLLLDTPVAPSIPEIETCPALDPEVCESLRVAREMIGDESAWCKCAFENDEGQMCVSKAIQYGTKAVRGSYDVALDHRAKEAFAALLTDGPPPKGPDAGGRILSFNDDRETTHADVMDMFARLLENCE